MDGYFIGVDKCRMHQAFHRFLCPLVTGHVAIYVWPMALARTPWTKSLYSCLETRHIAKFNVIVLVRKTDVQLKNLIKKRFRFLCSMS